MTETIIPGQLVYVANRYLNSITRKKVKEVRPEGAVLEGERQSTSFGLLHPTQGDAEKYLISRQDAYVAKCAAELKKAEAVLSKLKKKFAK